MHAVVEEGKIMNWDNILVANFLGDVKIHKDAPKGKEPPFYMAAYLLDLVCAAVHFLELKLQWGHKTPIVYELFQILWIDRYLIHFYSICNLIIPQIF